MLSRNRDERCEELKRTFAQLGLQISGHGTGTPGLPTSNAWTAAMRVIRRGSLDSMVNFLGGLVFGWQAGEADEQPLAADIPTPLSMSEATEEPQKSFERTGLERRRSLHDVGVPDVTDKEYRIHSFNTEMTKWRRCSASSIEELN